MICKIFISIFTIMLTISFGQVGKVSFNKARLVPKMLNYQGYLTDTLGSPVTDNLDMTFKIFDAVSSGNELWFETQTNVSIERGVFSVILGETTPIPDSVFADFTSTWLELTLEGPQTLTPRTRITSVGYAYTSTYSDTAEYARNFTNDGDWTITDNNIYSTVSGNVGIGTTTPGNKLHVNGNAEIDGNLFMNSHTITGVTNLDIAQIQGYGIRLYSHDYYAINFGGGSEFRYGPVTAYSIKMNMADSPGYGWVWGVDNQVPVAALDKNGDMQLAGNLYVVDSIGIGSSPTQEFDVNGNMRLTGAFYDGNNEAGTNGQVLSTAGSIVDWIDAPADNDWTLTGNVLYPAGSYGLSMRSSNVLYGPNDSTHVNFGIACTTGIVGPSNTFCTVSGGTGNTASWNYATVGGGRQNTAGWHYATVGGGFDNTASGYSSVVCGGDSNTASDEYTTVGGGELNDASGYHATVAGGRYNTASGWRTSIGGGEYNSAGWGGATVAGGAYNSADSAYTFIGGGNENVVAGNYSAILGGYADTIATGAQYSYLFGIGSKLTQDSTFMVDMPHIVFGNEATGYEFPITDGSVDQLLVTDGSGQLSWGSGGDSDWTISGNVLFPSDMYGLSMRSGNVLYGAYDSTHVNFGVTCTTGVSGQDYKYCTVGGGMGNTASNWYATVGGGYSNTASGNYTTVGGGMNNTASYYSATVSGGESNTTSEYSATVGGGYSNTASGKYATVCGGRENTASDWYATVGGGYADTVQALYGGVSSGWHNIAGDASTDTAAFVGGGRGNKAIAKFTTVSGGIGNTARQDYATVGGGRFNTADSAYATVGGGFQNTASDDYATVGGGRSNDATDNYSTVGGGYNNTADTVYTTVGGGYNNTAGEVYATVGGGRENTASYRYATVSGGYADTAAASNSFATNYSTKVLSDHSSSAAFTTSHTTASNQVRAANFSTGVLVFTMDHPKDPMNKILNQHAVGSSEAMLIYSGSIVLDANGRAMVNLPDYFDDINKNPRIQLTGVGTSDIYVAEDITGNSFIVGGKPNTKVYWEVTGERTDIHADIARIQTPVEQQKTGDLIGHSLDDDALIGIYDRLQQEKPGIFSFKTDEGRRVHEQSKHIVGE